MNELWSCRYKYDLCKYEFTDEWTEKPYGYKCDFTDLNINSLIKVKIHRRIYCKTMLIQVLLHRCKFQFTN